MWILSRVCVEFRNKNGESIFTVGPDRRVGFIKAPDSIREDPIFDMLIADGSLEVTEERALQKRLEADPMKGISAEGKRAEDVTAKGFGPEKKPAAGRKTAATDAVKT